MERATDMSQIPAMSEETSKVDAFVRKGTSTYQGPRAEPAYVRSVVDSPDNIHHTERSHSLAGLIGGGQPVEHVQVLSEARTRLVHCAELLYPSNFELDEREHSNPSISICLSGSVEEILCGIRFALDASSVFVRPAEIPHVVRFGAGEAKALVVELKPEVFERYPHLVSLVKLPAVFHGLKVMASARRLLGAVLSGKSSTRAIRVDSAALTFLSLLLHEHDRSVPQPSATWLDHLVRYLNDNYLRPISVKSLALRFRLHPTYMGRVFRQELQISVFEYVKNLRIEHAVGLLSTTDDALYEIANACAFKDQAHFSRVFKARMGLPPSAYRQLVRSTRQPDE